MPPARESPAPRRVSELATDPLGVGVVRSIGSLREVDDNVPLPDVTLTMASCGNSNAEVSEPKAHDEVKWTMHAGCILGGAALLTEKMTIDSAKIRAVSLPGCQGFVVAAGTVEPTEVIFRDALDMESSPEAAGW